MKKSRPPTEATISKETHARMAIDSTLNAAAVLEKYAAPFGKQDVMTLHSKISPKVSRVQAGDLQECEAMLFSQALALQSMFMDLSRRAATQEYLKQYETHFRLALKAQSQCRATLETLGTLRNPQVVFARQANIANGPQQVNNTMEPTKLSAPAREINSEPNELLEHHHDNGLDTGKTGKAGTTHPAIPAMAEINRAKNS